MAEQATRQVSIEAGELKDVTIKRVSLVDRGANRVPFRIEKRDSTSEEGNDVLQFGKRGLRKAEEKEAAIACLVVGSGADIDAAKARVEKSGISIPENREWAQDAEGNHFLAFVDEVPENGAFYKFDNTAGVVLTGAESVVEVAKQSMDFSENLGAAQFIPGMFMANDALLATVMTVIDEADSKGAVVEAIKSATEAFGQTLVAAAQAIPEDVFKLDAAFAEPVEKGEEPEATEAVEKTDEDKQEGGASEKKVEPESVEKSEDEPEGKTEEAAEANEESTLADVMKAVSGLSTSVEGLISRVEDLGGQVTEAKKAADEATVLARKSDRNGTALGGVPQGDGPGLRVRTKKAAKAASKDPWTDIGGARRSAD